MAFVDSLIDNDEVASSKKHTHFKIRVLENPTLHVYKTKMTNIDTLLMTKAAEKPCPLGPLIHMYMYLYSSHKGVQCTPLVDYPT